jgi:hypothetical protein
MEALNMQACINTCQTKTLKKKKNWTHCLGIQAEGVPCREYVGRGEHRGYPLHLVEVVEGYQHQEGEGRVVVLRKNFTLELSQEEWNVSLPNP